MSGTTLRAVIEEEIARAFAAGAQWACIWRFGQPLSVIGREKAQWERDPNYDYLLKAAQRRAVEAIPKAILNAVATEVRQGQLFGA